MNKYLDVISQTIITIKADALISKYHVTLETNYTYSKWLELLKNLLVERNIKYDHINIDGNEYEDDNKDTVDNDFATLDKFLNYCQVVLEVYVNTIPGYGTQSYDGGTEIDLPFFISISDVVENLWVTQHASMY